MRIDGKKIAREIYKKLKEDTWELRPRPSMCIILVGKNSPSLRYVKQKRKWADYLGYTFELIEYSNDVSEEILKNKILELNADSHIHGIMVQTPLPNHICPQIVIDTIDSNKDIDGFSAINQGKILIGDKTWLAACTPAGIMEIFESEKIDIVGKHIVIIGRSNIVWKPLANLCINAWATVTICHSKTLDISLYTRQADILIVATGKPKLIQENMLKKEAIVIDVGFSVVDGEILWDTDFHTIEKNHRITPNPGWVGPLTVAMLMKNVYKAYQIQMKSSIS